jgi:hypothetical protein
MSVTVRRASTACLVVFFALGCLNIQATETVFSEDFEATTLGSSPPNTDNWTITGAGAWFTVNGRCVNTQNHTVGGSKSMYSSGGNAGQGIGDWNNPGWGPVVNGRAVCWFYDDMAATKRQYISVDNTAGNNWLAIMIRTTTSATAYCYRGSMTGGVQVSTVDRTLGWHKASWIRDTNNTTIYLDDIEIYVTPNTNFNNFSDFDLGSWSWDSVAGNTGMWFDDCFVERGQNQRLYRWYNNNSAENPTARAAENTPITGVVLADVLRLRVQLQNDMSTVWSGSYMALQYRRGTTGTWTDLGAGTNWSYADGLGTNGNQVANALLTGTTTRQHFVETLPSPASLSVASGGRAEWDFTIRANASMIPGVTYYFRVVETDSAGVYRSDLISYYPVLTQLTTTGPNLKTWVGRAGGPAAQRDAWSNPANWNPVGVPGPTNDVLIPASAVQDCRLDQNATVNSLYLESGRSLVLSTNNVTLTVTNSTILGGTVTHSSNATFAVTNGPVALSGTYTHSGTGAFNAPGAVFEIEKGGRYNLTGNGAIFTSRSLTIDANGRFSQTTNTNTVTVQNLTIQPGGVYQNTVNASVVNISGVFTNNGSMAASTGGSWRFTGAAGLIAGTSTTTRFYDLRVDSGTTTVDAGTIVSVLRSATVAAGASLALEKNTTLNMSNGSTLTANGSFKSVGTGLLPGEQNRIMAPAGSFTAVLNGSVEVSSTVFDGISAAGITLGGGAGITASIDNTVFSGLANRLSYYLNITGAGWAGAYFEGIGFEEVGAGPNTTGTISINIPGAATYVTVMNYPFTSPPWSAGETSDNTPADDLVIWGPLAVTMGRAAAWPEGGGIVVAWEAVTERANAGFHIERAVSNSGPWKPVTASVIEGRPSSRDTLVYRWLDTAPSESKRCYRVVDVDLSGHRTAHPAFTVSAEKPFWVTSQPVAENLGTSRLDPRVLSHLRGVRGTAVRSTEWLVAPTNIMANSESPQRWRLVTRGEGIFEIDDASVLAGMDILPGDPVTLECGGKSAFALWAGSALRFYAPEYSTRHTMDNVTFLTAVAGPEAPAGSSATDSLTPKVIVNTRIEENGWYYPDYTMISCPNGEAPWYSLDVLEPTAPWVRTVDLGEIKSAPATLSLRLVGFSASQDLRPDHRVTVLLNGVSVGEAAWDGWESFNGVFSVSAGILVSGTNTLRLEAVDLGGTNEVLVDWVEFACEVPLKARSDFFAMDIDSHAKGEVAVDGFTGADVSVFQFEDGTSWPLTATVQQSGSTYTARVAVIAGVDGARLVFAGALAIQAPLRTEAACSIDLRSGHGNCSYIVIGPKAFRQASDAIGDYRSARGQNVLVADVEDVYDEFNYGRTGPEGVLEFIAWQKPRYVLLMGDATSDPLDFYGLGEHDFVSACFVHDWCSEILSDEPYCRSKGAKGYDVAVGRLPARDLQEALDLVAKVQAGEQGLTIPAPAVFAADDGNDGYKQTAEEMRTRLGGSATTIYIGPGLDAAAARTALHSAAVSGARVISFVGHGSTDRWTAEGILESGDAATFALGHPTALIGLSCLNGSFDGIAWESMSEALLRAPSAGAWVAIGSAGFADEASQSLLGFGLAKGLADGFTWGDALLFARRELPADAKSVLSTFNLLGDPASASVPAGTPALELLTPGAGDALVAGQTVEVLWAWRGDHGQALVLKFSADGGATWTTVAGAIPNTGRFDWTVPDVSSANCRLRISSPASGASAETAGAFGVGWAGLSRWVSGGCAAGSGEATVGSLLVYMAAGFLLFLMRKRMKKA